MQAALNAALTDLPGDLPTLPTFRKVNPSAAPILILALTSQTMPPSAIYDAADSVIAQRIVAGRRRRRGHRQRRRAAGDPRPRQSGRGSPSMGVSMEDVRTAIANANAAGPLGTFDGAERADTIATNDQLRSAARLRQRSWCKTANGTVVRLAAIATVEQSVRNSRSAGLVQPAARRCC